jgi:shikimate 5-dehydrogenase
MPSSDRKAGAAGAQLIPPLTAPAVLFVGITASQSSIIRIFPHWAEALGLKGQAIHGVDIPKPCDAAVYGALLQRIRRDPLILGAVVTSHKTGLFDACHAVFDELDDSARALREVSGISKRKSHLIGQAKDPITSGLALETMLPSGYWQTHPAEVLILGAGGSALAVSLYLSLPRHGANRPRRIVVANRSPARLATMEDLHRRLNTGIPLACRLAPRPEDNDALVHALPPYSLVINATGLGKDAPGSPLTDRVEFPAQAIAWDFNARGKLLFLDQARAQPPAKQVRAEDGWIYFLYGWTQHISEICHVPIPTQGPLFETLSRLAAEARR